MAPLLGWVLLCIVTSLVTLVSAAYLYSKHVYSYFQKRGIPYEKPVFPFGNLTPVVRLRQSYNEMIFNLYKKHKGKNFVGFFQFFQKSVLVIDRDLIKQVLVKDFEYFNGKNIHYDKDLEPLSAHLFALDGDEWKFLRQKLTPAFSSGKLKGMFQTIADVAENLNKYLVDLSGKTDGIDCKPVFMRYGIAIIANTAFGFESDVFVDDSSTFFKLCEAIMAPNVYAMFRNAIMFFGKNFAKALKIRIIPKDTHEFITKLVEDVVQYREAHNKERNDFLQVLIKMKQAVGTTDHHFTMDELAAQSYVFILAGFETVSNAMSYFLYEMALNPDIQKRVLAEVDQPETITYDTLGAMEYFDMAFDEMLRKYTPLGFLGRECSQDYKVPGTNDVIEKGTHVLVSTHGLHWDPELFPDPERFIPERFSKENKSNIQPYSYMPFGEGPRFCIGMRFGKLVVKTGLAMLLRRFRVEKTSKTPYPLKYDVHTINTTVEGGIWLRLVPRTTEGNSVR